MKRNGIHQWIGVSIMVLSLLFLFGAPVWAQVNADAGIAIDMDITTRNYDAAGTDIDATYTASATGQIYVGLVALDVENARGIEVKVTFDPTRMQYDTFLTENAMAGITNFLASNGGEVMGTSGFLADVDNELNITVGIAGSDDSERVSGSGLIGIIGFTLLDTEANNELNLSYAKITEVTGSVYDELSTTTLEEGGAVVNPVTCDATAQLAIDTIDGLTATFDTTGSSANFVIDYGDGTVPSADTTHTYDAAGTYNATLTATGTDDCQVSSDPLTVTVTEPAACTAAFTATNQTIGGTPVTDTITVTQGDTVLFNASGSDGAVTYQWLIDGSDVGDQETYIPDTSSMSGNYTVTLQITCASGNSEASMSLTVEEIPAECEAIITGPATAEAPSTVELYADSSVFATGDSIISYSWAITDPDGNSAGTVGGNPGHINISSIREAGDQYSVVLTISTANGCSDESEAHIITVADEVPNCDNVSANISAVSTALINESVTFDASGSTTSSTTNATITDYHWNFDDGSQDNAVQSVKEYSTAYTYTVTLTVTDSNNCTDTATHAITITDDSGLLGDADDNGVVDVFDSLLIAQYDAGIILASQVPGFDFSDVDDNDVVDINDALGIAQYDVGLPCSCLLD